MAGWEIEVEKVHVDNLAQRLTAAREDYGDVTRSQWEQIDAACNAVTGIVRSGAIGGADQEFGVAIACEDNVLTVSVALAGPRPVQEMGRLEPAVDSTPLAALS